LFVIGIAGTAGAAMRIGTGRREDESNEGDQQ
jgi:hypothetical protein